MRILTAIILLVVFISCGKNDLQPQGFSEISSQTDSTGKPIYVVAFPGTFTPIGDGWNDTFGPEGYGFETNATLEIFDNKSVLIFYTNQPTGRWDGRFHAGSYFCQQGEYTYRFAFTDAVGAHHSYKGTILLVR